MMFRFVLCHVCGVVPVEAHHLFSHSSGCQLRLSVLVGYEVFGLILPRCEALVI